MQIKKGNFNDILDASRSFGAKTTVIASRFGVSNRQVQRIKEAGSWERWPYILAKANLGLNTPEYKAYLRKKGLPLTPPPKQTEYYTTGIYLENIDNEPKKSWWRRLLGLD